jgi:hypothetical protein
VVASIDGLPIEEEEKTIMFGVEAYVEESSWALVIGVFVLEVGYTSINVCTDPCLVQDPWGSIFECWLPWQIGFWDFGVSNWD